MDRLLATSKIYQHLAGGNLLPWRGDEGGMTAMASPGSRWHQTDGDGSMRPRSVNHSKARALTKATLSKFVQLSPSIPCLTLPPQGICAKLLIQRYIVIWFRDISACVEKSISATSFALLIGATLVNCVTCSWAWLMVGNWSLPLNCGHQKLYIAWICSNQI